MRKFILTNLSEFSKYRVLSLIVRGGAIGIKGLMRATVVVFLCLLFFVEAQAEVYVYKDCYGELHFTNVPGDIGASIPEHVPPKRIWSFISDMNCDGAVTISDVTLWTKWLYFYPGDLLVMLIVRETPNVARFFEITDADYGKLVSFAVSGLFWLLCVTCAAVLKETVSKTVSDLIDGKN